MARRSTIAMATNQKSNSTTAVGRPLRFLYLYADAGQSPVSRAAAARYRMRTVRPAVPYRRGTVRYGN